MCNKGSFDFIFLGNLSSASFKAAAVTPVKAAAPAVTPAKIFPAFLESNFFSLSGLERSLF